jgi:hypothetical protein
MRASRRRRARAPPPPATGAAGSLAGLIAAATCCASMSAAPVSTANRKVSASASFWPRSCARRRRSLTLGAGLVYVMKVPPSLPRLDCTKSACCSSLIASRSVRRLIPSCAASSRSGGNRSPGPISPSLMTVSSRSTVSSNALPSRTGRRTLERSTPTLATAFAAESVPAAGQETGAGRHAKSGARASPNPRAGVFRHVRAFPARLRQSSDPDS